MPKIAQAPLPEFDERRWIHLVLQITGLAPYHMGSQTEDTHLSKCLVVYNLLLVIFVIANTYFSEYDEANDGMYSNKTEVVDTAFNLVDWLGNIYVSGCIFLSIIHHKRSCVLFYEALRLDTHFETLGVNFDQKKKKNYFLIKITCALLFSIFLLALFVFLEENSGNHYTVLYWICVLHPMLVASLVTMVFGSCAINLYSQLWVINEFLRTYMKGYEEKSEEMNRPTHLGYLNSSYEKTLEEIILAHRIKAQKCNIFSRKLRKIKPDTIKNKKPFMVFIINFPQCFEKKAADISGELHRLRKIHFEVFELGGLMNNLFGSHFLCIFVWYFFGVVIHVYTLVTFHVQRKYNQEFYASCTWTAAYLFLVTYIISFCNLAVTESKLTLTTIYKFLTKIQKEDVSLRHELQSFAMQLAHNALVFNASGFFTVNPSLLFSFIIGAISNVIFVIQFDKLNLQEGKNKK